MSEKPIYVVSGEPVPVYVALLEVAQQRLSRLRVRLDYADTGTLLTTDRGRSAQRISDIGNSLQALADFFASPWWDDATISPVERVA
ncbi:MAG: hypothetical protein LBJ43_01230 [Propionibacteriaceae bacterium]|jgi:hypothetical protein|nr:hypothetical protein [Propionibacteriaceae bacterium]